MSRLSAGILLWRRADAGIEVLIAHPGGPFFARKHEGAWSIPKGLSEGDEAVEHTARREWEEETGFDLPPGSWLELGETRLLSGKVVLAWGVEGDVDVAALDGNTFELEWPPRSGMRREYPEIDEIRWVGPDKAARLLNPAQVVFVERLLKNLASNADS